MRARPGEWHFLISPVPCESTRLGESGGGGSLLFHGPRHPESTTRSFGPEARTPRLGPANRGREKGVHQSLLSAGRGGVRDQWAGQHMLPLTRPASASIGSVTPCGPSLDGGLGNER